MRESSNGSAARSELGRVWLPLSKYMALSFLGSRKRNVKWEIRII